LHSGGVLDEADDSGQRRHKPSPGVFLRQAPKCAGELFSISVEKGLKDVTLRCGAHPFFAVERSLRGHSGTLDIGPKAIPASVYLCPDLQRVQGFATEYRPPRHDERSP